MNHRDLQSKQKKPRVAFFDFAGCEGCQVELTNFGSENFLELLKHIDIVECRELITEKAEEIDIACIEGSFARESDRQRLLDIRRRAKIVVAYGACAVTGGINALKNHQTDYREYVYGKDYRMPHLDSADARPIANAIKVDYVVPGCPISRDEFLEIISHLLHEKEPVIPNYPVCVECKRRETICRYEQGDYCMGQVARAGCGAPCPADGIPCEACRGFVDNPNLTALQEALMAYGDMSKQQAEEKYLMFTANCSENAE